MTEKHFELGIGNNKDDNLDDHLGAKLERIEIKDAPDIIDDENEVHAVQFLEVTTSNGCFTMANHNEHNGCYAGFWIAIERVE